MDNVGGQAVVLGQGEDPVTSQLDLMDKLPIHMFLGLQDPDPDPPVRGMDPDPDPDPSIIMQK